MSDIPRGNGWWQARDGKWYPPTEHPQPPEIPTDSPGSETKDGPGWWRASNGRFYPPGATPGGQVGSVGRSSRRDHVIVWSLAGLLVAGFIWVLVAGSGDDPPQGSRMPSGAAAPSATFDEAAAARLALETTWNAMANAEQRDVCVGVSLYGLSETADLLLESAGDTALTKSDAMEFLNSKC